MKQFRARLRPPKPILWLGCIVECVELRVMRTGGECQRITYSNMPVITYQRFEAEDKKVRVGDSHHVAVSPVRADVDLWYMRGIIVGEERCS